ncbi:hypothetical protein DFH06DRAFT_1159208 [Mycena polygramma]|nr:hypothetical protein DFH06DRAFT_1159208 [Mycena polygramma]
MRRGIVRPPRRRRKRTMRTLIDNKTVLDAGEFSLYSYAVGRTTTPNRCWSPFFARIRRHIGLASPALNRWPRHPVRFNARVYLSSSVDTYMLCGNIQGCTMSSTSNGNLQICLRCGTRPWRSSRLTLKTPRRRNTRVVSGAAGTQQDTSPHICLRTLTPRSTVLVHPSPPRNCI